ncbi:hypothetical protein [Fusobacterium necrophorum]
MKIIELAINLPYHAEFYTLNEEIIFKDESLLNTEKQGEKNDE